MINWGSTTIKLSKFGRGVHVVITDGGSTTRFSASSVEEGIAKALPAVLEWDGDLIRTYGLELLKYVPNTFPKGSYFRG